MADESQRILAFIETDIAAKRYEYAVLATDLKHELLTIAQLYRDRADVRNGRLVIASNRALGFPSRTNKQLSQLRLSLPPGRTG